VARSDSRRFYEGYGFEPVNMSLVTVVDPQLELESIRAAGSVSPSAEDASLNR
jgi:hypothetical protein